jgi:hypothetical protein
MGEEISLKLGAGPEPLGCPVDGCGESRGRIRGLETRRDEGGVEESITIAFTCSRGHMWGLTIDERAGGLVYEAWGRGGPV